MAALEARATKRATPIVMFYLPIALLGYGLSLGLSVDVSISMHVHFIERVLD